MKWKKRGLIYGPDDRMGWAQHSALTPTPILVGDVIRVYAGFRDSEGISRIGYIDVDADNPSQVIAVSDSPALDIGEPGAFDDNGVILGDVIRINSTWYMYYVGFQLVTKAKFLAFTGLATSNDGKEFSRFQKTPVLDRSDEGIYIRAIHTALFEGNIWKIWYAAGNGWSEIDGGLYPQYEIRYLESNDGLTFAGCGRPCIKPTGSEYRIGRPRVFLHDGIYSMLYTKGTLEKDYLPGFAQSLDGLNWIRHDTKVGLNRSENGWDSRHVCYPTILNYKNKVYLFYNGNDMGKNGFGYAELISWD